MVTAILNSQITDFLHINENIKVQIFTIDCGQTTQCCPSMWEQMVLTPQRLVQIISSSHSQTQPHEKHHLHGEIYKCHKHPSIFLTTHSVQVCQAAARGQNRCTCWTGHQCVTELTRRQETIHTWHKHGIFLYFKNSIQ